MGVLLGPLRMQIFIKREEGHVRGSLAWSSGISLTCQIQLMIQSLESLAGDKILLTLRGHTCVMGLTKSSLQSPCASET